MVFGFVVDNWFVLGYFVCDCCMMFCLGDSRWRVRAFCLFRFDFACAVICGDCEV